MIIWGKILSIFDSMPWVIVSAGAGAFIGWILPFNGRMLLFYVTVVIGVIWFLRLYRNGNQQILAQERKTTQPLSKTTSSVEERIPKSGLDERVTPLTRDKAREWLDEFVVRQQGRHTHE